MLVSGKEEKEGQSRTEQGNQDGQSEKVGREDEHLQKASALSLTRNPSSNPSQNQNQNQTQNQNSTFHRSCQIELRQPIGSMSLSPANRDVILAARSGLFILDLERPYDQPRFLANLTSWEVADIQWNPHPSRSSWVASTSNQKLLVWNLDRPTSFRTPSTKFPPPAQPGAFSYGNATVTSGLSAPASLNGGRSFNSTSTSNKHPFGPSSSSINSRSLKKQSSLQSFSQDHSQSQSLRSSQMYPASNRVGGQPASSGTGTGVSSSIQDSQLSIPSPETLHGGGVSNSSSGSSNSAIEFVLPVHTRAITDVNWSAFHPDVLASCSLDTWSWVWDLRTPRKPVLGYSAWNAAMTSVKWNRASPHRLATSCDNKVLIWDSRKGSLPLASIEAHESRIYGIDWSRDVELGLDRLVTCSLDATVKYWDLSSDSSQKAIGSRQLVTEPQLTIRTDTPIWRARNLPFGEGVMTLPQRGDNGLSMWAKNKPSKPVKRFEGHNDTVKEFLWRTKGGSDREKDDRKFQLLTWGKDQILRMWPISEDDMKSVDHLPNQPMRVLHTRARAPDISYREPPSLNSGANSIHISAQNSQGPTPTHTRPGSLRPSNSQTPLSGTSPPVESGKKSKPGYDLNNLGLGSGSSSDGHLGPLAQLSRSLGTQGPSFSGERRELKDSLSSNHRRGRDLLGSSFPESAQSRFPRQDFLSASGSNPRKSSRFKSGRLSTTEGEKGKARAGDKPPTQASVNSDLKAKKKAASNKNRNSKTAMGGYMTRGVGGGGGLPLTLGLGMGSGMGAGNGNGGRYGYSGTGGAASGREALGWIEGVRMLEGDEAAEASDVEATGMGGEASPSEAGALQPGTVEGPQDEEEKEEEEVEEIGASGLGKELATTAREWPRAMFEKVEVSRRQCTVSLYGPWATSNVLPHPVFIRISFRFPAEYPTQPARFDLERTANVSLKTRAFLLRKLAAIVVEKASQKKGCLGSCISFLFGEDLLKENHLGLATIPLDAGRRLEQLERDKDRTQYDQDQDEEEKVGMEEPVAEGQRFYGPYETKSSTIRHTLLDSFRDSDEEEAGVGGVARPLFLPPVRSGASFGQTSGRLVVFRSLLPSSSQPEDSEVETETDASHSGFTLPPAFQKLTALHPANSNQVDQPSPALSATVEKEIDSEIDPKDSLPLPPSLSRLSEQPSSMKKGARPSSRGEGSSGNRFLRSYDSLSKAMGNLARLNPDFNQESPFFNKDISGVHDSDVVQLMSSDFVKRRMKARSNSRIGSRSKSNSNSRGRRNGSSIRGNESGASTPFGLNGHENIRPLDFDGGLSEVKIYDYTDLLGMQH